MISTEKIKVLKVQKVGKLALLNPALIELFTKNNIDFYCLNEQSLNEAIVDAEASQNDVLQQVSQLLDETPPRYIANYNEWPLDLLSNYIQQVHHKYTERTLTELKFKIDGYLENGEKKELAEQFSILFNQLRAELSVHMKKEELTFFPLIRKMVAQGGGLIESPRPRSVETPIENFVHEHEVQHNILKEIRTLLGGFNTTFENDDKLNRIEKQMKELAEDLALHLHVENNILFPKALTLEQSKK